ncbi:hypothetical protein HY411_03075 [Candidatus Gottesmanbacteria bacterium]|nr:hypothetical protein [Candidatus Gottesmanbacteria bacterium]
MESTSEPASSSGQKAGGNKILIIVAVVLLILVVGGFAAQKLMQKASTMVGQKVGEKVVEGMLESATGGKANVDVTNAAVTVKTKEGAFSTSTKIPADWPADAPVYPGSTVTYSGSSNPQTGESGYAAVLTTSDSAQKVRDYYSKELISQGWKTEATYNANESSVISATKDTRTFTVATAEAGGTTTITLGVSQKSQ